MKTRKRIEEIREDGIDALAKKLGPDGMIRFIQQFDSGRGDYTKDRHALLDNYTIDEIVAEIEIKKK
jgi:hypothetical protein